MKPRRVRTLLLVAAAAWFGLAVVIFAITGGVGDFLPGDPAVPTIGFTDAGDGRVAVEIVPTSFAATQGIEIRSGAEARDGRLLWKIHRTRRSTRDADGRVVVGEVPDGFAESDPLDGPLPTLWHAEVDNRCYFGSAPVPKALAADAITLSSGERVTPAGFRAGDRGFSECDTSTVGSRAAVFVGLVSAALGGVCLVACFIDWRRGLPKELTGPT